MRSSTINQDRNNRKIQTWHEFMTEIPRWRSAGDDGGLKWWLKWRLTVLPAPLLLGEVVPDLFSSLLSPLFRFLPLALSTQPLTTPPPFLAVRSFFFPYSTSRPLLPSLSVAFSLSFFLSPANSLFSLTPAVCQTPTSLSILKPSRHSPPPPSLAAAVFPQLLYQQLTPET